jgi:hypothetical protein
MLAMDLFLAISQGIGVSIACGFRAFLAPLVVAVMARGNLAIDFDGSGWEFLESIPFIVAMVVLVAASTAYERPPRQIPRVPMAIAAGTLGALEFGGTLATEGYSAPPGIVGGALCAVLGLFAMVAFVGGAQARLAASGENEAGGFLNLIGDGAAVITAALGVLISPISFVPLAFCIWVLVSHRRRAGKKYEGLRVLR